MIIKNNSFTPLRPESPAFQSGDEWQIKIKSSRNPRLLRRGVTGFTKKIFLIFLLGLVIRLGCVLFLPQIGVNRGDSGRYDKIAQNLLTKHSYTYENNEPDVFWPPGYPFFLASMYKIFGINYPAVRVIQAILSSLLILLVYYLGSRLFNHQIGILSAIITAIYPGFIGYSGLLLPQLLVAFLIILFIFLIKKFPLNIYLSLVLGLIAGYSSLVRAELILFWFIFLLIMAFIERVNRRAIKFIILIFTVMFLVVSAWTIRNYKLFGKLIPVSIHYGDVMWYSTWKGEWLEYRYEEPYTTIAEGLKPVETADAYFKASIRNIKEHPFIYLKMCIKRLFRLWTTGHSNIFYFMRHSFLDYLERGNYFIFFIKFIMLFFNLSIILLGFLGIRIAYAKFGKKENFLYYITFPILFFIVLHFFIFATPRYAISVMPYVITFASYALFSFLDFKQRNKDIGFINLLRQFLCNP